MNEIWKNIKNYEGYYQISNFGRVKSLSRFYSPNEHILKPQKFAGNYKRVFLCKNNNIIQWSIHRLVATYFIPNPLNLPEVNHNDGNPANNFVKNLEWSTKSHNAKHAWETGLNKGYSKLGINNPNHKLNENDIKNIRLKLKLGERPKDISLLYNVHQTTISKINRNKNWRTR